MKKPRSLLPRGEQVAEWEQELNVLVFEVYDLTGEEIRIIGGGSYMTRDQQKLEEPGVLIHKRFLKWIKFWISIL